MYLENIWNVFRFRLLEQEGQIRRLPRKSKKFGILAPNPTNHIQIYPLNWLKFWMSNLKKFLNKKGPKAEVHLDKVQLLLRRKNLQLHRRRLRFEMISKNRKRPKRLPTKFKNPKEIFEFPKSPTTKGRQVQIPIEVRLKRPKLNPNKGHNLGKIISEHLNKCLVNISMTNRIRKLFWHKLCQC